MSKELYTIAIDPGVSGGFASFIGHQIVTAWKFTTQSDFISDLNDMVHENDHEEHPMQIVLEDVPPFVGKNIPSSRAFKLGVSCGFYQGVARGMKLPLHMVPPKTWQKGLSNLKKSSSSQRKRILKDHATRLYPDIIEDITLKTADAVLIGHFFINQNNNT